MIAIVDSDLRDQHEESCSYRINTRDQTRQGWKDMQAKEAHEPILPRRELKNAIGCFQQPLRVRQSLFVIGLEQTLGGLTFDNQCEFPGQVVSVLDTRVHALRARRTMNVRGISGEKKFAVGKLVNAP